MSRLGAVAFRWYDERGLDLADVLTQLSRHAAAKNVAVVFDVRGFVRAALASGNFSVSRTVEVLMAAIEDCKAVRDKEAARRAVRAAIRVEYAQVEIVTGLANWLAEVAAS